MKPKQRTIIVSSKNELKNQRGEHSSLPFHLWILQPTRKNLRKKPNIEKTNKILHKEFREELLS
ncbi:MAG: hypothetical protein B9S37_10910 [Verrucomicrobiia bacterium Tous-C3TDCM]|nr:MAG: hypothetical protein B9S37_10910 [Verrucomicrobiae bacterium Tous-C3TDCM]PAZ06335.1 MAG: hypothetical protein CAK88_05405 [Verrucomicrobiae bacterium AMD-G2]